LCREWLESAQKRQATARPVRIAIVADEPTSLLYMQRLIERITAAARFEERRASDGPLLPLVNVSDSSSAGYLRLWVATDETLLDRLIHCRLQSGPVDTHLLFVFGRTDTPMPHFHGQVVQFGPDGFVYNADIIPRLDPVEHPDYYTEVYAPITKAYWSVATNRENVASMAPANPAIAAYLSPWSIAAGRPTNRAELDRAEPSVLAYLDHYLDLARTLSYRGPPAAELRARDARHLTLFQSDELDPRAWKGVYRLVGEDVGQRLKEIFKTPIRQGT
jgi:hypothetical protein